MDNPNEAIAINNESRFKKLLDKSFNFIEKTKEERTLVFLASSLLLGFYYLAKTNDPVTTVRKVLPKIGFMYLGHLIIGVLNKMKNLFAPSRYYLAGQEIALRRREARSREQLGETSTVAMSEDEMSRASSEQELSIASRAATNPLRDIHVEVGNYQPANIEFSADHEAFTREITNVKKPLSLGSSSSVQEGVERKRHPEQNRRFSI